MALPFEELILVIIGLDYTSSYSKVIMANVGQLNIDSFKQYITTWPSTHCEYLVFSWMVLQ
jgi:hypothetical protein